MALALRSHFLSSLLHPNQLTGTEVPFEHFTGFHNMAAASRTTLLQNIFDEAETPQELKHFVTEVLDISTVADLIEYVVRKSYQEEWKDIITGAFPLREEVRAREATDSSPAVAAVSAFTTIEQRKLIARMRATYKIALGAEQDEEDTKAKTKADQITEDMEKPLDPDLKRQVAKLWDTHHSWKPTSSMRGAPKFTNRVVREFRALCVTNHTVEKQ